MKRFFAAIKKFFLPPADSKTFLRIAPLLAVAFIVIIFFAVANYAWEESNSITFCGLTCHTMPPEYVTHQHSAHTNVTCEDCHMGRDRLAVMIPRKVSYSWQTGTAMLFGTFEYPIVAKNMAPARQACENCHKPEQFSSDTLVDLIHYAEDEANTRSTTTMVIKTGGGTERQGLGFGIHWHIENPVYFYATDRFQQNIPYIMVSNPDGSKTEYVDVESGFDPSSVKQDQLVEMDCITCHNRTAHLVTSPTATADELIGRGLVSDRIPNIKQKTVELLSQTYGNEQAALDGIAGLENYYQTSFTDFYSKNTDVVKSAIQEIQSAYQRTNFPDQKVDWKTHPNNIGHMETAGCFRCHDGKHLTSDKKAVRLECNLCHSIPIATGSNRLVTNIEISRGPEPGSHQNSNWISLHGKTFDETCQSCHNTADAGGTSDTSFCSNSLCHGAKYTFAGFDAPKLREILGIANQVTPEILPTATPQATPEQNTPVPAAPTPTLAPTTAGTTAQVTYEGQIAGILKKCTSCHGEKGQAGLNLSTYQSLMAGGNNGPVIVAGDPNGSGLIAVQTQSKGHYMQLTATELQTVIDWIKGGALEK